MVSRHTLAALCCTSMALGAAPALAGGESEEWASLDREIAALAQEAHGDQHAEGVRVSGVLRTNYAWFDESPTGEGHYSGFALDNVRPRFDAEIGDFAFQIELEAQSGTALVLDAYAEWNISESFRVRMGRFQPPVLRSALVDPENLLFILRTGPGQFWQERDEGIEAGLFFGPFLLAGSLENGEDGAGNENAYTFRGQWDVLGEGVRLVEGAYGSGSRTCLTIAASYRDDEAASDDGSVIAADAALTSGGFSIQGEWLQFGDDTATYDTFADTNPWAVTASFMLDPERYELALRYETLDDEYDAKAWTLGLNRYVAGHDVKWVLNVSDVSSDLDEQDGLAVGLGLTVNV